MKSPAIKYLMYLSQIIIILLIYSRVSADGGLTSYYKVGTIKGTITEISAKVEQSLESNKFKLLGSYNPGKDQSMKVIAFTRQDLIDITLQIKDRGALACVLRVGLITKTPDSVEVSLLNPEYLFYGYLRDEIDKYEKELNVIAMDVRITMSEIGRDFTPFGGASWTESELKEFKYMPRYPGFDEPVILHNFNSFEEGVSTIQRNLKARKGETIKVYELVFKSRKVAVFGVGLSDKNKGEANFLEILGKANLSALPYEIILIGKQATMLHGRFRFPFYWSHLSMADLKRIYKIPKDIEYVLQGLTK